MMPRVRAVKEERIDIVIELDRERLTTLEFASLICHLTKFSDETGIIVTELYRVDRPRETLDSG